MSAAAGARPVASNQGRIELAALLLAAWRDPDIRAVLDLDYSDKATTKAQTVAERTLLLVLGLVPTDDPDPDASYIERGNESRPSAEAYLAEITNPMTSRDRMRQIYNELGAHRLMHEVVEHEGDRGELGALFTKVANERWPRPDKPVHRHESEFEPDCPACQAEQAEADRAVSS